MFICQGSFIRVYHFFSDLQSRSFLIFAIYFIRIRIYKKKDNHQRWQKISLSNKKRLFFYTSIRAAEKLEAATRGILQKNCF